MKRGAWLVAFLVPLPAQAYVQTMTCDESGMYACRAGEVAKPVRWPRRCVHYYINELGTADIDDSARTNAAIQRSFTEWSDVEGSEFVMEYAGLTNDDRAEHSGDRGPEGNANVMVWRDDDWPYASRTAFAITSVTFDPTTGLIADADMEFNTQHHRFTVSDAEAIVDLANTATHEAGHFLGLDHTSVADATMFGSAPEGETQKRTLHADDIEGLLAVYPPVGITPTCDEVPSFFEAPDAKSDKGCCATAAAGGHTPGLLALVASVLLLRRRRESDEVVER